MHVHVHTRINICLSMTQLMKFQVFPFLHACMYTLCVGVSVDGGGEIAHCERCHQFHIQYASTQMCCQSQS